VLSGDGTGRPNKPGDVWVCEWGGFRRKRSPSLSSHPFKGSEMEEGGCVALCASPPLNLTITPLPPPSNYIQGGPPKGAQKLKPGYKGRTVSRTSEGDRAKKRQFTSQLEAFTADVQVAKRSVERVGSGGATIVPGITSDQLAIWRTNFEEWVGLKFLNVQGKTPMVSDGKYADILEALDTTKRPPVKYQSEEEKKARRTRTKVLSKYRQKYCTAPSQLETG